MVMSHEDWGLRDRVGMTPDWRGVPLAVMDHSRRKLDRLEKKCSLNSRKVLEEESGCVSHIFCWI